LPSNQVWKGDDLLLIIR